MLIEELYAGLSRRPSPEEVGKKIVDLLDLHGADAKLFPKRPSWWTESSMPDDWQAVATLDKPLAVLSDVTATAAPAGDDPDAIRGYLESMRPIIGMKPGRIDYKFHRLSRKERVAQGLGALSRRRYDKLFRLIGRLETYADELEDQLALAKYNRLAKTGFSSAVAYDDFAATPTTGAFVAWHNANAARRSLFTAGRQAKAYDEAGKMLMGKLVADPATNWYAVAHAFPRADVLARLTPKQLADLLAKSHGTLADLAKRLEGIATKPGNNTNIETMTVGRGDDSSTWNALAGAWNKARDMWISAANALDPTITDAYLPGKVMRLMAADVVYWHRGLGGDVDPDTKIWAKLPKPWDVLSGDDTCTRAQIEDACYSENVDPDTSGWARARPRTAVEATSATPETVRGVIVHRPEVAALLRKSGWFKGSRAKVKPLPTGLDIEVIRDHLGVAIEVE